MIPCKWRSDQMFRVQCVWFLPPSKDVGGFTWKKHWMEKDLLSFFTLFRPFEFVHGKNLKANQKHQPPQNWVQIYTLVFSLLLTIIYSVRDKKNNHLKKSRTHWVQIQILDLMQTCLTIFLCYKKPFRVTKHIFHNLSPLKGNDLGSFSHFFGLVNEQGNSMEAHFHHRRKILGFGKL